MNRERFDDIFAIAVAILLIITIGIVTAIGIADAKTTCKKHGEKYLDSSAGYTLCEREDGTIVRR